MQEYARKVSYKDPPDVRFVELIVFYHICTRVEAVYSYTLVYIYSLFVFSFYGLVNPIGSCRSRSVSLSTL